MTSFIKISACAITAFIASCCFSITYSQSVDSSWNYINTGEFIKAEEILTDLADNKSNEDACMLLSYYYELKQDYKKAWEYFYKAIKLESNPEPFIIAAFGTYRFAENFNEDNKELFELLEKMSASDSDGYIKTVISGRLGNYYKRNGNPEKAQLYFNRIETIMDWQVVGPFENVAASGYYREYPPEKEFNSSAQYTGKETQPIHWFKINKHRPDKWIDFENYFLDPGSVYYANTFVYSPVEQKVQLRIGTSGFFRVFLNDKIVMDTSYESDNGYDTYISEMTINKGWNRLLVKCGYSEVENCNFALRLTDDKGFTLKNLEYSSDEQQYTKKATGKIIPVKSPVEEFFRERLKNNPADPVNYLLLADIYARNDKTEDRESVYLQALEKFPDNLLVLYALTEMYKDEGKTSKFSTVLEKIEKKNIDLPLLYVYKIDRASDNNNTELQKKLYAEYLKVLPESPLLYMNKISYYELMKLPQKVSESIEEGLARYPDNWDLLDQKISYNYEKQDIKQAISSLQSYYKTKPASIVLDKLKDLYLTDSNEKEWENVCRELIARDPAWPYGYFEMADKYFEKNNIPKAIELIKEAINIRPFSSWYYTCLGDYYKADNKIDESISAYQTALKYSPTNFTARDALNEITNPDSGLIQPFNIYELLSSFTMKPEYAGTHAIILLKNKNVTLYPGGANETTEEYLVKGTTEAGINALSKLNISYNSNMQEQIVDKAVVIKNDGSEIAAENAGNTFLFKSLQVNDNIYIKYRVRNTSSSELTSHFWDQMNFGDLNPTLITRYSIIRPKDMQFYYKANNMSSEPDVDKISGDKHILIWEKKDLPAMPIEDGMPGIFASANILYVTDIAKWQDVSSWYYNITRSKIIPDFEVKKKTRELMAGKENAPVQEKINIIYDFISKNITYNYYPFLMSAYIPRKASEVLQDKFGDCKDVTTLFISMLSEINVNADYVLLLTSNNGKVANALPGILFNHVIAKTNINGRAMYYDLAADQYPMGMLPDADLDAFALEVTKEGSEPHIIEKTSSLANTVNRKTNLLINPDNSLTANVETIRNGNAAVITRAYYKDLDEEKQRKLFSEKFSQEYSNFTLNNLAFKNLADFSGRLDYSFNITFNNYLLKSGSYLLFKIPWSDNIISKGISYDKRKYPLVIGYDDDFCTETAEIKLPDNYSFIELPENKTFDCAVASCTYKFNKSGNKIISERILKVKKHLVAPDEYLVYKNFCNDVINMDATQLLIKAGK